MIKNALLVIFSGAILFALGAAVGYYQFPPFKMMREIKQKLHVDEMFFSRLPRFRAREGPVDIVMLGDSITAGIDWKEQFPQSRILSLGVGGDTSAGVVNRLEDVIYHWPHVVFVMIGVNDILADFPLSLTERNIQFIATRLASNGIQPIIQSTLYVSNDVGKDVNIKIRTLNNLLRNWCTVKAVPFIDLNDVLSVAEALLPEYSHDGIHLNRRGYAVWKNAIVNHVQRTSP